MPRLVPFEPAHLARVVPGRFELAAVEGLDADLLARGGPVPGPALSVIGDAGAVLGCAGIVPLWPGVGQGWLYAADALRARPVFLHRLAVRGFGVAEAMLRLHRVQVAVHEGFAESRRWVLRLGFACEGAMPGYGPNRDTYIRYARVTHVD